MSRATLLLLAGSWAIPLLLSLMWTVPRLRRWGVRLAPGAAAPALALALLLSVSPPAAVDARLGFLFTGVQLTVDATARTFLLLTALLWFAAGIFARSYHARDPRAPSFFLFFLLTMGGNLGVVLAGDLLTFYLFFALMTFAAYGLVVHARDRAALRAGRIYIVMAVLGELALLAGLLSVAAAFGGVPLFGAEIEGAWRLIEEGQASALPLLATGALLVIGFGVKAGLVPLHLWLPLAHPVAPTAASALLSGVMIKAGLLGWIRILPAETAIPILAGAFMGLGAFAAFYGVLVGLAQDDPKTVLAYSSVSQMGTMAMGTGLLLHEAVPAALALGAIGLYALHHGVAKGALFLSIGLADRVPRSGGRTAPGIPDRPGQWILVGTALPALALAGLPLSSGALAKNALKEGLGALGGISYAVLDPLLLLAAAGTTLLMIRLLVTLAHRRREAVVAARSEGPEGGVRSGPGSTEPGDADARRPGRETWGLIAPWMVLVAAGLLGILWMPGAVEAAPRPGLLDGWIPGILPVLAGAAAGGLVYRRPGLLGSLRTLRVPAGDLLIPVESLVGRVPRLDQERGIARLGSLCRNGLAMGRPLPGLLNRAARADLRSIEGAWLGLLLFGLGLLLFWLLR